MTYGMHYVADDISDTMMSMMIMSMMMTSMMMMMLQAALAKKTLIDSRFLI